jgi:23S rRNA (cytidine1920-2'-O)/16S rRNA (cytidine1409-2'-O)-methyltransferase
LRRLDQALVERGHAESRTRAQALIAAGVVLVDGRPAEKPAQKIAGECALSLTRDPMPYVSRAALKLTHALAAFSLSPAGAVALDLGVSTGGFSQVLLEAGASEVWAVDVGHGQLHPSLGSDSRLHAIEGLNVRKLSHRHVPSPDWIVSDLSFISLEKALPPALGLARSGATLISLIKPQFEVGRENIGKGGIVRNKTAVATVRARVRSFLESSGWQVTGETESPIRGGDGNTEFLVCARKRPSNCP